MLEFAVTLPLMMLLMLACAELGRAFFQYNTLTKTARDGVRHLAANASFGSTGTVWVSPQLQLETANLVVFGNVAGTGDPRLPGLDVSQVTVSDEGGALVSVSVTWTYGPMLGQRLPALTGDPTRQLNVPLSASVVMRAL